MLTRHLPLSPQITHPLVLQALVVSNRIERAALVPFRPDGDTLMRTNPHTVEAAYSAECFRMSIKCVCRPRQPSERASH